MSPSSPQGSRVVIFGNEYSIKGDVDSETTRRVADYVNQKVSEAQKSGSSRDKLKTTILSTMNIAGELFEYRGRCKSQIKELNAVKDKAQSINKRIDDALDSLRS
ncbi:MAG: cell division protein ZapA [Chitinivibrionales bacterium]|nr:cell division protein ZapA [Chitinivibrionales bacterium]